jgi:hypothetical protein
LRVFVTKAFRRFQRKESIADEALCAAIARANRGLIDADLGRGLIKQRVARKGQGRSGGFRTIVAFRIGDRAVFMFGFVKSRRGNLGPEDERDLADYGTILLGLDDDGLDAALTSDELKELECDD